MSKELVDTLRLDGLRKENARAWAEVDRLRSAIKDCADGGPCAKCAVAANGEIAPYPGDPEAHQDALETAARGRSDV